MNYQIELELTYLVRFLPKDLDKFEIVEIFDMYLPALNEHPKLRLRKNNSKMQLVKKILVSEGDLSVQIEQTIELDEAEFKALRQLKGKAVHKLRYKYPYQGYIAEIDVFLDQLEGLVVVDFEFQNEEEKDKFKMPDFCLVEVTQEKFIAGGLLAGKAYSEIERYLKKYNYQKIILTSNHNIKLLTDSPE